MREIVIREASLNDAPRMAEIHADSFGSARWTLEQIQGSLMLASSLVLVAEAETILGFLILQVSGDEAEILTFCVDPAARRKGIGESLLKEGGERTSAAKAVFLEVAADNHAARALYTKLGFKEIGVRPNYYKREGEKAIDAVLYCLGESQGAKRGE